MVLKNTYTVAVLALLLFTGCAKEQWDDCITSAGPLREEVRLVGEFHTVALNDRVDLVIEERTDGSISVEAGRNLLGQVITEVNNGILSIRNDNRCNWVRSFKPRITVRVPLAQLAALELRGTGNITCTDTIRREGFTLQQWGAQGSAMLLVDVDRIDVALHTGAGDVTLTGRCNEANLYNGIMGPIDASALDAINVNVNNSGVTDIRCAVDAGLNVQIRDAGDVYYNGDPTVLESQVTGSGQLYKVD